MDDPPQWLLPLDKSGMTESLQWPVVLDTFDCLSEDPTVLMEKPGLDIEKSFNDLCNMATSLSQVFTF